jgi:WXXGXW repeat (2 copies)
MNKSFVQLSVLSVALLASAIGCADQSANLGRPVPPGEQPGPTVVYEAPPAPLDQGMAPSPGPQYAYSWVPGYWTWQGHWVWTKGAWLPRPAPNVEWRAGFWAKRGHHYIWIRGCWQ